MLTNRTIAPALMLAMTSALATANCSSTATTLALTVSSDASVMMIQPVPKLRVTLTPAKGPESTTEFDPPATPMKMDNDGGVIPPMIMGSFFHRFPVSWTGMATIKVEALDQGGAVLVTGTGMVDVVPDQVTAAQVMLTLAPPPGSGGTGGMSGDMGTGGSPGPGGAPAGTGGASADGTGGMAGGGGGAAGRGGGGRGAS